jgi:RimJ/RimL family protein N-acetyltransferase
MASIGYWVADKYQRKGYAQEAIRALAEFCFAKLSLTRVEIVCDPDNIASQTLIESVGAKKEAIARNRFIFHGKPKDGVVYSLLPTDL